MALGLSLHISSEMMTPGSIFSPVFMFHSTLQSQSIIILSSLGNTFQPDSWVSNIKHKQHGRETTNLVNQQSPVCTCCLGDILYLSSKPAQRQNLSSVLLSWASLYITYELFIFSSDIISCIKRTWTWHSWAISTRRYQKRFCECGTVTHIHWVPQWWDQWLLEQTGS